MTGAGAASVAGPSAAGPTPAAPSLAAVVAELDRLYPPAWAESWDAVGLVVGDPDAPVRRILFAVDPVDAVVDEAVELGADLLVTHHPMFLRGVHGFAATTPKGRRAHRLVRAGIALHTAHTNADVADPGVSDALAAALGIGAVTPVIPLRPAPADPLDVVVVYVPQVDADALVDALSAAGAGQIGDYSRCAFTATGVGTFRPDAGAAPTIGSVGTIERVDETRIEMVLPRERRAAVVAALRVAHPYEEPAFSVLELAPWPGRRGLGRVGELAAPVTFGDFAAQVAGALPATAAGIRAAGDPDRRVHRIAVCGGAGDDLFGDARAAGADVLVTADLRHHPVSEAIEGGGPLLIDPGHWASEWPWLPDCAHRLQAGLAARGATVEARVSRIVTDPWTAHLTAPSGSTR